MKIVFWGNGARSEACLDALIKADREVCCVVAHPYDENNPRGIVQLAQSYKLPLIAPQDPNDQETQEYLNRCQADVFVLGGYGKIIKNNIIQIPKLNCINLHGGKLPECRGSSPLNWALINGWDCFSISIIEVDRGVDTGPVLKDKTFSITSEDTIIDLHKIANSEFPLLLLEVLNDISKGTVQKQIQDNSKAAYYPLRFSDDGFILWDSLTATEVANRVRALTEPYPCAFTVWEGRKVKICKTTFPNVPFYGEPGRIYKISSKNGILVCASDQALWIKEAIFEDTGEFVINHISRYDQFPTMRGWVLSQSLNKV